VVVTAEPELIRELFGNRDPELFAVFATGAMEAFFGTRSVLTSFGEPHKQERKLLTPPFHGERMRAYGSVMVESTRRAFAGLAPGQPFVALERTTEVSLEAIVRAVFGMEDRELVERTQRALRRTLDAAKPMFLFSKATQVAPFGLGPWATYSRASAEADRLLYEQIERTRPRTAGREDIPSVAMTCPPACRSPRRLGSCISARTSTPTRPRSSPSASWRASPSRTSTYRSAVATGAASEPRSPTMRRAWPSRRSCASSSSSSRSLVRFRRCDAA
jgi:cytochrome P450